MIPQVIPYMHGRHLLLSYDFLIWLGHYYFVKFFYLLCLIWVFIELLILFVSVLLRKNVYTSRQQLFLSILSSLLLQYFSVFLMNDFIRIFPVSPKQFFHPWTSCNCLIHLDSFPIVILLLFLPIFIDRLIRIKNWTYKSF